MWRAKLFTSIELRHLRYFLAAAEHGSFRKAGLALRIQESSVSRRIRDLEQQLGTSLFQRRSSGVVLTSAGHSFHKQARKALEHLDDGARNVDAVERGESGYIRVGIFSSLSAGFLHDLFKDYNFDWSGVSIDFSHGHPLDHITAVQLDRLDVAFMAGTAHPPGCEVAHLWSEQVFVALPAAHPLTRHRTLSWQDLIDERFVVSEPGSGQYVENLLLQRLTALGRSPVLQRQNVGCETLLSLAAVGRGLTLASETQTLTSSFGLEYRPIANETLSFSAIWSPKNGNPALRRLLGMAHARRQRVEPAV